MARLHLDENQCSSVHRDKINLSADRAIVALDYPVAASPQMALGDPFATLTQRNPVESRDRPEAPDPQLLDSFRQAAEGGLDSP